MRRKILIIGCSNVHLNIAIARSLLENEMLPAFFQEESISKKPRMEIPIVPIKDYHLYRIWLHNPEGSKFLTKPKNNFKK